MPNNIEIKARCKDLGAAVAIIQAQEDIHQLDTFVHQDTYFHTERGLAKLRVINPGVFSAQCELLIYHRSARESGPRLSYWQSFRPTSAADSPEIKKLLSITFGVDVEVIKVRTLYMFENVRIHFDTVEGLGEFIEFEALYPDSTDAETMANLQENGKEKVKKLMQLLQISDDDLVAESYYHLKKEKETEAKGYWPSLLQSFLDILPSLGMNDNHL